MKIFSVANALAPEGLNPPTLNTLVADANNYTALLLQPRGEINATNAGIKSRNRELAGAQFGKFLEETAAAQPDLVVTPEYSMPWDVLQNALISANGGPPEGKLWALGCESIRYSELQQFQRDLSNIAKVIFEPMQVDDNKFLDPLAYVFRTTAAGANADSKLVVLVQFKTHPMADPHDFERNSLQLGTKVYQFGNYGGGISLTTFICSDFLGFTDTEAGLVYDRALILHLQLNNKRQHASPVGFRERLLRHIGRSTEILTLNWARGTRVYLDGIDTNFKKFAGSAWCLKANDLDLGDATVAANHRKGIYYTWLSDYKAHVMFLNFGPAVYRFTASKVERIGVQGPAGNRRGPQLDWTKTWDVEQGNWANGTPLNDGFDTILNECGGAMMQVKAMYDHCPIACERLLALCAGDACKGDTWYTPESLDCFKLRQTELIFRVTFCQASHDDEAEFRVRRLRRCGRLWDALQDTPNLPRSLEDVSAGYTLEWTPAAKHQNLRPHAGNRGHATVMFLGDSSKDAAQAVYDEARQRVHVSLDERSGHMAKQRIATWYIDEHGMRKLVHKHPKFDDQLGESPADIGRGA